MSSPNTVPAGVLGRRLPAAPERSAIPSWDIRPRVFESSARKVVLILSQSGLLPAPARLLIQLLLLLPSGRAMPHAAQGTPSVPSRATLLSSRPLPDLRSLFTSSFLTLHHFTLPLIILILPRLSFTLWSDQTQPCGGVGQNVPVRFTLFRWREGMCLRKNDSNSCFLASDVRRQWGIFQMNSPMVLVTPALLTLSLTRRKETHIRCREEGLTSTAQTLSQGSPE